MNRIDTLLASEVASAMNDIFDTFSKTEKIKFYKLAQKTVAVQDPSFNIFFPIDDNITYEPQYEEFSCRIFYLDKQDFSSILEGSNDTGIRVKQFYNRIRIQIKSAGAAYLRDTELFKFGDEEYKVSEPWRRLGVLKEDQLYQIILERVN